MLLLTSTSDLVRVTPAQAASIEVHASWVDNASGTITPGRTNTAANSGTSVFTVVASPASSTQRNVKHLSVRNDHASASSAIDIDHYDGTTAESLWKGTLLAGESVVMGELGDWTLYDNMGVPKANNVPGRFISMTVKTSGTTHTVSTQTNSIRVRAVAGGGGGANATGNATQTAVGGGGGSSGYVEKWFQVTPGTQYSLTVGTGGPAGTIGVDSTFVVGGVTITAKAGGGGVSVTQTNTTSLMTPGSAGGTTSTNGDINYAGAPGLPGVRAPGTAAIAANTFTSGAGGSSVFGGGGVGSGTAGNGAAASGYGSGGAGGLSNTTGANNGGAGSDGVVIIEEYT